MDGPVGRSFFECGVLRFLLRSLLACLLAGCLADDSYEIFLPYI